MTSSPTPDCIEPHGAVGSATKYRPRGSEGWWHGNPEQTVPLKTDYTHGVSETIFSPGHRPLNRQGSGARFGRRYNEQLDFRVFRSSETSVSPNNLVKNSACRSYLQPPLSRTGTWVSGGQIQIAAPCCAQLSFPYDGWGVIPPSSLLAFPLRPTLSREAS